MRSIGTVFMLTAACLCSDHATSFVVLPSVRTSAPSCVVRMGFFDNLFKPSGQSEDNDWKEKEWREQQEILRKRRENYGYLSDEEKSVIRERRAKVGAEEKYLSKVQEGNDEGVDSLEAWKKLRDEGKIKTANSGLERDEDSSRLGSEGLFAERIDAKLPYIESGYVPEETEEKGSGEPFGDLSKMFGKR